MRLVSLLGRLFAPVVGLTFACTSPPERPAIPDTRTALKLAPEEQEAVLLEMRTMLTSLNGVLGGLAASDSAVMHKAAMASGLATAVDPALEEVLPEPFLKLGIATHSRFDSLAAAIAAGASRDSVIARLSRLTSSCVSCHATYRLSRP